VTSKPCEHLLAVEPGPIPETGCIECMATGDTWVHLRYCVTCGEIRCCDDSRNQHASKHAAADGHPVIRSAEPYEMWAYCYEDDSSLADVTVARHERD
jgi:CPA2 family monovalent cation:H+ antiporter-2